MCSLTFYLMQVRNRMCGWMLSWYPQGPTVAQFWNVEARACMLHVFKMAVSVRLLAVHECWKRFTVINISLLSGIRSVAMFFCRYMKQNSRVLLYIYRKLVTWLLTRFNLSFVFSACYCLRFHTCMLVFNLIFILDLCSNHNIGSASTCMQWRAPRTTDIKLSYCCFVLSSLKLQVFSCIPRTAAVVEVSRVATTICGSRSITSKVDINYA